MVERFGYNNVSDPTKTLYDSNAGGLKEQWYPLVNVVCRKGYFGVPKNKEPKTDFPWVSIWYEMNAWNMSSPKLQNEGLIQVSGFDEFPFICPRWSVVGENFYGESPAMNCLGDCMELQLLQKRKSEAIDKMVKPPMIASPNMINQKMSILPGDVTFADTREGNQGFKPAFEIKYNVRDCMEDVKEHQGRTSRAMYNDIFMLHSDSDRREITAEEIRAREQEKMHILGPVVHRLNDEALKPIIKRVIGILERKGKLPPIPDELRQPQINPVTGRSEPVKINVEFESILAQAAKLNKLGKLDRLLGIVGNEVAINSGITDVIDLDQVVIDYAEYLDTPSNCKRDPDEVKKIRANRQQQQMQAQQAENAQKTAAAAQTLSQTDTRSPSALRDMIQQQTGQGG